MEPHLCKILNTTRLPVLRFKLECRGNRSGPGKMVHIRQSPYLDGIFVPGSGNGDVTVSSAGHRFQECPTTSGLYYSNVICQKNCTFFDPIQQTFEQSAKQFTDSGFLYLHSNMGLTVDLNAVRACGSRSSDILLSLPLPGLSTCGTMNRITLRSMYGFWWTVRFSLPGEALQADQGYDIHVDISDADQFLSLVVTDGGQVNAEGFPANHYDTCGFAEPVFGLVSP